MSLVHVTQMIDDQFQAYHVTTFYAFMEQKVFNS